MPSNIPVFTAALSGALSGMVGGRSPGNTNSNVYNMSCLVAAAYAAAVDTLWNLGESTLSDIEIITSLSEAEWCGCSVSNNTSISPLTYYESAKAIIAVIRNARTYYSSHGINPPQLPITTKTIPFSFLDSTIPVVTVANGQIVLGVSVRITNIFNDNTATLQFGTITLPNLICNPLDTRLNALHQYEFPALISFSLSELLRLIISPGTSTQGNGILSFFIQGA